MGYIVFYASQPDTAYISLIAVKTQHQNQGIGGFFINACERIAKEREMSKIKLEVQKDNKFAFDFYKNKDFRLLTDCTNSSYFIQKNL